VESYIRTAEKGPVKIDSSQWKKKSDRQGRNNNVVVMELVGPILYQIEAEALKDALTEISNKGPIFILLEIDSPGGRIDLAQDICAALITTADNVEVISYVRGGQNGGAISAAAAVALATDKIYMSSDSVIGAATMITWKAESMKEAYGETVGEKFNSAWRARLASLAERKGRPGMLARAMVEKDLEIIEVNENGKRFFIEAVNKKPDQELVKTWSPKGSLLTLTAGEAVQCGFADGLISSRRELLKQQGAADANVVVNGDIQRAGEELRRAQGQLARIRKSFDYEFKKAEGDMYYAEYLQFLREARVEMKTALNLAKKYPDLNLDVKAIEDNLNTIEASYRNLKRDARRH
jgi:ATP-dependent protease ClpP protease subunit